MTNGQILDGHAHAFPDHLAAGAIKTLLDEAARMWKPIEPAHDGTVAGLLGAMDRAGVQRTVLCSVATRPKQVRNITDWSASLRDERIIPFASIHPDFDDVENEMRRIADFGLAGVKYHPQYMNCAVDDLRTVRIAKAAAECNLAMTMHAGDDLAFPSDEKATPRQILALHVAVPNLRLLACHMGGWQRWEESLEYVAGRPIYIETSFSLGQCPQDLLERIIERHPTEYLMFGSDSPWSDPAGDLAKFEQLPLDDSARRAALWDNGHRLCGMNG